MDIQKAKKLIPDYLDDVLQANDLQSFKDLLGKSPELRKEVEAYKKSWAVLGEAPEIEPAPDYVSQVWTKIAQEKHVASNPVLAWFYSWQLKPAVVTLCLAILIGVFSLRGYWENRTEENLLSQASPEEIEIIREIEIVQNLEIIEELDFYENMDVIEEVGTSEESSSSKKIYFRASSV